MADIKMNITAAKRHSAQLRKQVDKLEAQIAEDTSNALRTKLLALYRQVEEFNRYCWDEFKAGSRKAF